MSEHPMNREDTAGTIGIVVPIDYLSVYGGSVQRIKADVEALIEAGYKVEVILPSRIRRPQGDVTQGPTLVTYPNIQGATFLPEKARMLFDMHTQRFSPFFRSTLRKRYAAYSVVFGHSPWCAVAAFKVIRGKIPLIYVAYNFEYDLIKQATRNPLVHRLVYDVERYACQKADKILCVSELDMSGLQSTYAVPASKLAFLPNIVDVRFFSQAGTLYDKVSERAKLGLAASAFLLLFHGRMDYSANLDALQFITRDLMPALRQSGAGEIRLVIAGAQIPRWCLTPGNEIISCYSDVPDMRRFLSIADAVIVPLNIGGGTRNKILESFAAGVPVISTAKGAEGIDCHNGKDILIAERNTDDFIRKIKMLAGDQDLRRKLTASAYNLVTEKYSIHVAARSLDDVIAQVTGR
jgi:glycosyltransferase involved in cell wall biosynthesis